MHVAVFTVATAIFVTACGGGDGGSSEGNDKIARADTEGETSASPSGRATDAVDRPEVKLPSDVTDEYEDWKTGDDIKDAILTDTARRIEATNYAILLGDTDAPGLSFYYRDKALSDAVAWVQAYVDANLSFTGTTRYYAPEVTLAGDMSASVVYCSDESKGFNKSRKTNKVDKTPSDESPYVLYNTRLEKNKQGVWQTANLISKRGDKKCTG
ncbi:hypothetical protein FE633_28430 [Streptomyces montanus]|uniref:Uncharacterized protein n=1 Tax=Streptomyces montanus TaxID=2580423 RepID=A0A5R9FTQ6_9ACTN|nr:hypothetical protein [Streptomyces montanus]TLS42925.1 hypothetical protein FE633_28430 [Streptomyces montanus]